MTASQEMYLEEVNRMIDNNKPRHGYDTHCLCYACEDTRADNAAATRAEYNMRRWYGDAEYDRMSAPYDTWHDDADD